jgi:N-methylhydantoinase A/oxoprolinase/acetone carboxylase beta subunit
VRTCLAVLDAGNWPRVQAELEGLVREVVTALAGDWDEGTLRIARSLELRYHGQNEALEVPVEGATPSAVTSAFHERHRAEFGYATDEPVEVTAVRARVWRDEGREWRAAPAAPTELPVGETAFGPVLARAAIEPGRRVEGPAVLADALSTVVVWPGQVARTDDDGNTWLEPA